MNTELSQILEVVRRHHPLNDKDVRAIIDRYFDGIVWSVLKDEFDHHMSEEEKAVLCDKVLHEIRKSERR